VSGDPSPPPAPDDLRSLVTGASSGIGEAFARVLRGRGDRLVLVARREERLARLAEVLGGEPAVLTVTLDLAAPGAGEQLEAVLRARRIAVDVLVNNAGVGHSGPFHAEPADRVRAMVELNVRTLTELTHRFLPAMVARGRGAVLNVASMSSFQPVPYLAVYAATKAYVLSFTEALAVELEGTGVAVQALCPGNIPTEFQKVAGTERSAYSRTPAMSAMDVARVSVDALAQGRVVVIPGVRDRVTVGMQRLVPRSIVRRIAGQLFRPTAAGQ
jgi:short-subunit dehydrogenase